MRQHAVILANRPAKMLIVRGLSPEARATIDQGRPRSVGDNLRILDGELREERRFETIPALVEQMQLDAAEARRFFSP